MVNSSVPITGSFANFYSKYEKGLMIVLYPFSVKYCEPRFSLYLRWVLIQRCQRACTAALHFGARKQKRCSQHWLRFRAVTHTTGPTLQRSSAALQRAAKRCRIPAWASSRNNSQPVIVVVCNLHTIFYCNNKVIFWFSQWSWRDKNYFPMGSVLLSIEMIKFA
jgi:hypothetical protein